MGVSCTKGAVNLPVNVSIPAVIAFGDSYLDQGNNNKIKTVSRANFPPYGKDFIAGKPTGRFSNGKSLADFFGTFSMKLITFTYSSDLHS
nr:GDSL esterase/lipase At5g42170-like [Tanacetum cinerariifolium]